jgi:hypothetical protein
MNTLLKILMNYGLLSMQIHFAIIKYFKYYIMNSIKIFNIRYILIILACYVFDILNANTKYLSQLDYHANLKPELLGNINHTKTDENNLRTEEVTIGVNWHLLQFEACSNDLFLSGNVFNDSLYGSTSYSIPAVVIFDSTLSFEQMAYNSVFFIEYKRIGNYSYINENNEIVSYSDNLNLSVQLIKKIKDYKFERNLVDPFIEHIFPGLHKKDPYNYFNQVKLDTLPNYYKIPHSIDWENTDDAYYNAISKVFYLILFKCKITYYPMFFAELPLPNLELDLSSPDPNKRSLCSFKKVPAPVIIKIEDLAPYNIR